MPFNGSGSFTPPGSDFPAVASTLIESAKFNNVINDIATALSTCVTKDGQTTITANIPLGNNKITGLAAGTAATDAANLSNVQAQKGVYVGTVGGTADVITLTPSPAITAYAAGQRFDFIASGANTTNVTVNVNSLGAKAVTKNGTTALVANDILSGALISIEYDGTQFQILNVQTTFAPLASPTFTGTVTIPTLVHTGNESGNRTDSGNVTRTGTVTMSGKPIYEAEGAAVASATTTDIWTPADGNTVHITGTTTIDSFGTAPQAGAWKKLIFDDAVTLTQSTNLNVNGGGSDVTTIAGDMAFVYADTTTQMDVFVIRKSGKAVTGATDVQIYTTPGANVWDKPLGFSANSRVLIQAWGGGGSGGTGDSTSNSAGGGGGGGAYYAEWFFLSDFSDPVTATVGAGGAAVASSSSVGNAGGNSTFGAYLTAYGGGRGGTGGNTASSGGGGGGGGLGSIGGNADASSNNGTGGGLYATSAENIGGDGGQPGTNSFKGGGGGGQGNATTGGNAGAGGSSYYGGGGGGGGLEGGGGSAGTGGTSVRGGSGGAGGKGTSSSGTAGTAPGGGGGGAMGGTSGAGGAGKIIVTVYAA